jgi:hypothetical protein
MEKIYIYIENALRLIRGLRRKYRRRKTKDTKSLCSNGSA